MPPPGSREWSRAWLSRSTPTRAVPPRPASVHRVAERSGRGAGIPRRSTARCGPRTRPPLLPTRCGSVGTSAPASCLCRRCLVRRTGPGRARSRPDSRASSCDTGGPSHPVRPIVGSPPSAAPRTSQHTDRRHAENPPRSGHASSCRVPCRRSTQSVGRDSRTPAHTARRTQTSSLT